MTLGPASNPTTISTPWKRRAVGATLLVFVLQLALIQLLSRVHPPQAPAPPQDPEPVHHAWIGDQVAASGPTREDPMLLASANAAGVSGSIWLKPRLKVIAFSEIQDPSPFLGNQEASVLTHAGNTPPSSTPLRPLDFSTPMTQVESASPPPLPRRTASQIRLGSGFVAGSTLLEIPPLPQLAATNAITNSLVRVRLDSLGRVFSALGVGVAPDRNLEQMRADELAVGLAGRIRVGPAPRSDPGTPRGLITDGVLIFDWSVTARPNGATP